MVSSISEPSRLVSRLGYSEWLSDFEFLILAEETLKNIWARGRQNKTIRKALTEALERRSDGNSSDILKLSVTLAKYQMRLLSGNENSVRAGTSNCKPVPVFFYSSVVGANHAPQHMLQTLGEKEICPALWDEGEQVAA